MAAFGGSLVDNILQKTSTLNEKVIDEGIIKITKKSSQLKGEILDLIRKQYVDFDSYVDSAQSLEQRIRDILKEHKRLSTRVEQDLRGRVARTTDERPDIEKKLKETQDRISFVQRLVSVYVGFENARKNLSPEKYVTCAEHIHTAAEGLQALAENGCDAKVYRTLKTELADMMAELGLKLHEEWRKFVQWKPQTLSDSAKMEALTSVELRLTATTSSGLPLEEIVKAMKLLTATKFWPEKIKMFARKLFAMFIRPLIINKAISVALSKEGTSKALKIVVANKHSISTLYDDITTVLTTARQIVSASYQKEWTAQIGEVVCAEMCELIIAHRLSTAIPRDSQELANYGELSSQTQQFENSLVKVGLAKEGTCQKLSQYTKEVNSHFAAQKSQDLLAKARNILMEPLHATVTILEDKSLERLIDFGGGGSKEEKQSTGELANLTFRFPKCAISKCVQDYIDLLYSILKDCCNSPSPLALQLFTTCRSMVDLFCAILSSYHRQAIAELPSVAMIQHNNCMFLAHHLITLGHQFHSRLPPPLNSEIATFVDLVPLVRRLGEQVYVSEMRKQSGTLLHFLHSFGGLDNVSEDVRSQAVQGALLQARLQIEKLSKVYAEVLPEEIHHRAVGGLLNVVVGELVKSVLALEDIAVDDATELHSILNQFLERGSAALSSNKETQDKLLEKYCRRWSKLRELAVVMDASLLKIVELWGGGKGVMAQVFTPMELRGLIKALFKNTDRRAAALAKITL
ncbi:centromere/kinetochore protein zw10 homolog [Halichondria panicea]|uniref:centromere/kinetochore protein zw10 homolog n=1 Tax=Halichondria panicea TaxID=6063 RepID=UPI00312BBA81